MKKTFYFMMLAALLPMAALGQKTIHVADAGTLSTLISDAEMHTITSLTVTGQLNGTDLRLLRDMAGNNYQGQLTEGKLATLDISGADIVEGGDTYLDTYDIYLDETGKISDERGFIFHSKNDTLPQWLFVGCNSLTSISLPQSVKAVEEYAFYNCLLQGATLPDGIEHIGERAFYHNNFMTTFNMPTSVRTIGANAFAYCSTLTQIELPAGIIEIGKNAFNKCSALKSVYSYMTSPCTITDKTFTVYDKATLYVPTGCKTAYQATDPWNKFSQIEEFTPTGMEEVRWKREEGREQRKAYDLQGRRLDYGSGVMIKGSLPGVVVVDGRKVVVK